MAKVRSKKRARKAKAKARRKPSGRKVSLRPAKQAVRRKIGEMKRLEQTPRVREAIGRMEEALAQFSQICGTHMIVPV